MDEGDEDALGDLTGGAVMGENDNAEMLRLVQRLLHDDEPQEPHGYAAQRWLPAS